MSSLCSRSLTGDSTSPPRLGPHWETIGFQGADPATDLRGAGMLALVQMQWMAFRRQPLMHAIYKLSLKPEADFPFMTVSINVTQIVLQALRAGALTKRCNKKGSVYEVAHSFHSACYLYMYQAWKARGLTIVDFGYLKNEITALALAHGGAKKLFTQLEQWSAGPLAQELAKEGFADF